MARMAQNEMKAMRDMPWRVRSTEGLGAGIWVFRPQPTMTMLKDEPVHWEQKGSDERKATDYRDVISYRTAFW